MLSYTYAFLKGDSFSCDVTNNFDIAMQGLCHLASLTGVLGCYIIVLL